MDTPTSVSCDDFLLAAVRWTIDVESGAARRSWRRGPWTGWFASAVRDRHRGRTCAAVYPRDRVPVLRYGDFECSLTADVRLEWTRQGAFRRRFRVVVGGASRLEAEYRPSVPQVLLGMTDADDEWGGDLLRWIADVWHHPLAREEIEARARGEGELVGTSG